MTVAFANPADLTKWLKSHTVSKRVPFDCYGDKYHYYILQEPDPDMRYWFGYNPHQNAFFITRNIRPALRSHILIMECKRMYRNDEDKSNLSAVKGVVAGQRNRTFNELATVLHAFYTEYAGKYEYLNQDELTTLQRDIIATATFLENLKG